MPVNEGLAYNASQAARGSLLPLVAEGICAEPAYFFATSSVAGTNSG